MTVALSQHLEDQRRQFLTDEFRKLQIPRMRSLGVTSSKRVQKSIKRQQSSNSVSQRLWWGPEVFCFCLLYVVLSFISNSSSLFCPSFSFAIFFALCCAHRSVWIGGSCCVLSFRFHCRRGSYCGHTTCPLCVQVWVCSFASNMFCYLVILGSWLSLCFLR